MDRVGEKARRFWTQDSGAVATDWAFMIAAVAGCGVAVVSSLSSGPQDLSDRIATEIAGRDTVFQSQRFGRDRLAMLQNQGMEDLTDNQLVARYTRFTDPQQRTDAQVRNAHRTWSRRVGNPEWQEQARARDMVRILDQAMELRRIEPHDDI